MMRIVVATAGMEMVERLPKTSAWDSEDQSLSSPRCMALVLLAKLRETLLKIQTFTGIQMETALHVYLAITKLCSCETCPFLLKPDFLGFQCKASGRIKSNGATKQDSTETEFIKTGSLIKLTNQKSL